MTVTLAQYATALHQSAANAPAAGATAVRVVSQQVEARARAGGGGPSGVTVTFPQQGTAVVGPPKPLGVWQDPVVGVAAGLPSPALLPTMTPGAAPMVPGAAQVAGQYRADVALIRTQLSRRWYGVAYRAARAAARRARNTHPGGDQFATAQLQARAGRTLATALGRLATSGISG
jgi:hypothetical protein